MKFYEFGNKHNPLILLLPGTCCHWKANFETVIPLLEKEFYVVCASYDGFDETEDTIFPDMLTETEKMENYINLDQETGLPARFKAWLIAKVLHGVFRTGKLPGFMQKRLDKKTPADRAYLEQMLALFGVGSRDMAFVKRESIRNQFYSNLVMPLDDGISVSGTQVHIFYAVKMGGSMRNATASISGIRIFAAMTYSTRNCWCGIPKPGRQRCGGAAG